jgi:hypothetical protein
MNNATIQLATYGAKYMFIDNSRGALKLIIPKGYVVVLATNFRLKVCFPVSRELYPVSSASRR